MILVVKHCIHTKKQKTASLARCFLFSLVISLLFLITACDSSPQRSMFVLSGPIMGTDYRITIATDEDVDQDSLHQDLLLVMDEINNSMSHYDPASELSMLNQSEAGQAVQLSEHLNQVLIEALSVSKLSDGAFDITLGPLIDLWGFGSQGTITQRPSLSEIKNLSEVVGYSHLTLSDATLTKAHIDTQLNLSAIAKGFAVDKVADELERQNIDDYLVNIGGELRAGGLNIDSQFWRVGIERPELLGGIQQVIELNDQAVATSGDYLNYLVFEGQRFSHTLDPVTLAPVLHRLASVSVVHDHTSTADALATAIMAMGEERGYEFAEEQQLAAYLVIRNKAGDGFHARYTSLMRPYIDK